MEQTSVWVHDPQEREQQFVELYRRLFPTVAQYVAKRGGTFDEAKDIFQDAVVIFYEKTAGGTLQIRQSADAYITGTAKFLWLKNRRELESRQRFNSVSPETPEETLSEKRILRFLETAGQKCMQLLQAVYYDKLHMSEIARRFGYSGERSATVQKHKCLKKVRETVKQKSLTYEDFLA